MREDPSFFADVVDDRGEHSSKQLLSPTRKTNPNLASAVRKMEFWDRTIPSAIDEVYENLVIWRLVSEQLDNIMAVQEERNGADDVRLGDDPGFTDTVRRLNVLLNMRSIRKIQRELLFIFPSSPPMRSLYEKWPDGLVRLRSEMGKTDTLVWLSRSSGQGEG